MVNCAASRSVYRSSCVKAVGDKDVTLLGRTRQFLLPISVRAGRVGAWLMSLMQLYGSAQRACRHAAPRGPPSSNDEQPASSSMPSGQSCQCICPHSQPAALRWRPSDGEAPMPGCTCRCLLLPPICQSSFCWGEYSREEGRSLPCTRHR